MSHLRLVDGKPKKTAPKTALRKRSLLQQGRSGGQLGSMLVAITAPACDAAGMSRRTKFPLGLNDRERRILDEAALMEAEERGTESIPLAQLIREYALSRAKEKLAERVPRKAVSAGR